jgi:hypothetical protein
MRLIAFGCSITYGHGLQDCIKDQYHPGDYPSKYAWPQLLSDKLNLECINCSSPGASNKEIAYRIQNFKFDRNDLVFVLWSYLERFCIVEEDKTITPLGPWFDEKKSKVYFKHLHNNYDSLIDFYTRANWAKLYLDKINIKNYHLTLLFKKIAVMPNWNHVDFLPIDIERIRSKYPKAQDNAHPGHESHESISTEIFKAIDYSNKSQDL